MLLSNLLIAVVFSFVVSCVSTGKNETTPLKSDQKPIEKAGSLSPDQQSPDQQSRDKQTPTTPSSNLSPDGKTSGPVETCFLLDDAFQAPPIFVKKGGFIITRLMKSCVTQTGRSGFEKNSSFTAMGLPCTGGGGRINWEGVSYYEPKLITFFISTNCPMKPSDSNEIQTTARNELLLTNEARLMAYNPFVVQYWEIPSAGISGTGFTIDVVAARDIQTVWNSFKKNEPIAITLFGRENAWGTGEHLFSIDSELVPTGKESFSLRILDIKTLKEDEVGKIKERCQLLRPRKNCEDIF